MLAKMPRVGDVLIANEKANSHFCDVTPGKEYEVSKPSRYFTHPFKDDAGDNQFLSEERLECFSLKSEALSVKPVGSIEEVEFTTHEFKTGDINRKFHVISLSVDDAGLASVRNLAKHSVRQSKRKHLQTKIDALQKELDAL